MTKLLLRVGEAAEMLAISRSKAYEMIAAGELPFIRIRDSIRIPLADLEEWIEAQKNAARGGDQEAANTESEGNRYERPTLLTSL